MIWFFERSGAFVRFESRPTEAENVFELAVIQPDGTETVERFTSSETLLERQQQLETALEHDGWQGPFGRVF